MKVIKFVLILFISFAYLTLVSGCSSKNNSSTTPSQPANQITIESISAAGLPAHPGASITATVAAQSQQKLALTYTWTTTGNWSVISGGDSPTATIQAPDAYGTDATATVIVTDAYGRYTVGTTPLDTMNNAYPVISNLSASPNPINRGGTMSLSVSATDEDGDALTYAWSIPNGWLIQSGQGTPDIQITAPYQYGSGGTATVIIDDGNGGVVNGSIPVSTKDDPSPVISSFTALPNPVAPGGTISASVDASDPDGNALSYTWTTTAGWTMTPIGTLATLTAPLVQGAGGYVTMTISDVYGSVVTGTIPIATNNAPLPPYNLQASAGFRNIALTWSTTTPATSYNIYEVTGPGTYSAIGTTITTAYKATDLTNGTSYSFVVTGVNASGESIYSNEAGTAPTLLTFFLGAPAVSLAAGSSGNIFVTTYNGIYVLSPTGTVIGNYYEFMPGGLAIDASGNLWGTDNSQFVLEVGPDGSQMATYNTGNQPEGIAIDGSGNIWVANFGSNSLTELGANATTCTVGSSPHGIAPDASGNIWVTNSGDNTVREESADCTCINTFATGTTPWGIAIDPSGNVWIANEGSYTVTELDSTGNLIATRVAGNNPQGIAIDASGNIWISSPGSVMELSPSGALLSTYSLGVINPMFGIPQGIAIDPSGNVWVVANGNVAELKGVATGPQYFPYSGPQFAGGGNW